MNQNKIQEESYQTLAPDGRSFFAEELKKEIMYLSPEQRLILLNEFKSKIEKSA